MKTILAAVDFSPAGAAVVPHAKALARAFNARVVLLTVVQPPIITSDYSVLMENVVEITAIGEKAASVRLAKLRTVLAKDIKVVVTEQATGSPAQAIVDAAKKMKADYIVMGSHGHTALYDLVVGSTTHGVLKRAPCPVVIARAEKPQPARRRARR